MEILYSDDRILVCVKPAGVLSTDEPGGLPELIRHQLQEPNAILHTVHRLDRAVGGLMVLARTSRAAADLSAQIRSGEFEKVYLAMVHGKPELEGRFSDFLHRDKARRMTFVVPPFNGDCQEAVLEYKRINVFAQKSMVRVNLQTGRTHQIRVQFASRGFPIIGDKKYGHGEDCEIGLWSCRLAFKHPRTGETMVFEKYPPQRAPWL